MAYVLHVSTFVNVLQKNLRKTSDISNTRNKSVRKAFYLLFFSVKVLSVAFPFAVTEIQKSQQKLHLQNKSMLKLVTIK